MRNAASLLIAASLVLVSCASHPPPPVVPDAAGVEPLSLLRTTCSDPVELTRDCSSLAGPRRLVHLAGEDLRVAGSADGRHVLFQIDGLMGTAYRGGPGYLTQRHNEAFAIVKAELEQRGIGVVSATPLVASRGALAGYLLELDADGYTWLESPAPASSGRAQASGPAVPEASANVRDADGTIAFLHFRPSDMPIVVEIPRPAYPPFGGSGEEALEALASGFEAWRVALAGRAPWLEFDVATQQERPDARVTWTFDRSSKRDFVRAAASDPARPKPALKIPLSTGAPRTQTFNLDWLRRASLYIAGAVLGLGAVEEDEAVMNGIWLMGQLDGSSLAPTDADVEAFCALYAQPSGFRIDGVPMQSLVDEGWRPEPRDELVTPCR